MAIAYWSVPKFFRCVRGRGAALTNDACRGASFRWKRCRHRDYISSLHLRLAPRQIDYAKLQDVQPTTFSKYPPASPGHSHVKEPSITVWPMSAGALSTGCRCHRHARPPPPPLILPPSPLTHLPLTSALNTLSFDRISQHHRIFRRQGHSRDVYCLPPLPLPLTSALKTPLTGSLSITTILAAGVTAAMRRATYGRQAWTGHASKQIQRAQPCTASAHQRDRSVGKKVRYRVAECAAWLPRTPECEKVWGEEGMGGDQREREWGGGHGGRALPSPKYQCVRGRGVEDDRHPQRMTGIPLSS